MKNGTIFNTDAQIFKTIMKFDRGQEAIDMAKAVYEIAKAGDAPEGVDIASIEFLTVNAWIYGSGDDEYFSYTVDVQTYRSAAGEVIWFAPNHPVFNRRVEGSQDPFRGLQNDRRKS